MTELRVRSANDRLRQEYGAPKGSARKPRKGKERAGTARSAAAASASAASSRPGTAESSESYQDEVSPEAPAWVEEVLVRPDDD